MQLWFDNETGTRRNTLQDFTPSLPYTAVTAGAAAWEDNPAVMGYRYLRSRFDNAGEKLDANALDGMIKDSGVQNFTLEAGKYSKGSAAQLIERQRQRQIAADIDSRTEFSWSETPIRALTRAGVALADPLNLAAMFLPPVGTEYFAARMAATTGAAGRFGTRMVEGAAQGLVGMAALEVPTYAAHKALGDDYTMTDSLANIFMGAGLGAVLHGVVGVARDRVDPGNWKPGTGLPAIEPAAVAPVTDMTAAMRAAERADRRRARLGNWMDDYEPEDRQAAGQIALAQRLQGQHVDVDTPMNVGRPQVVEPAKPAEPVTWDTIAPGQQVTLYRGENVRNEKGGQWWTTDPDKAARFGTVESVTLPSEVVGQHSVLGHGGRDEFVFPTAGKRPLDLRGAMTPEQVQAGIERQRDAAQTARTQTALEGNPQITPKEEPPLAEGESIATPAQQAANDAEKQLNDTVKNLTDSGFVPKGIDLTAHDEAIADAGRVARAAKAAATCLLRA